MAPWRSTQLGSRLDRQPRMRFVQWNPTHVVDAPNTCELTMFIPLDADGRGLLFNERDWEEQKPPTWQIAHRGLLWHGLLVTGPYRVLALEQYPSTTALPSAESGVHRLYAGLV
jgi:hypothetical protein